MCMCGAPELCAARLALEERLNVLPMWTFGDEAIVPQLWDAPPFLAAAQRWLKETTGSAPAPQARRPLMADRGELMV